MDLGASYTFTNSDRALVFQGLQPEYVIPKHLLGSHGSNGIALLFSLDVNRTGSYIAPVFETNIPFRTAELKFGGYTKADVFASYETRSKRTSCRLFFGGVENVFDREYYENGFLAPGAIGRGDHRQVLIVERLVRVARIMSSGRWCVTYETRPCNPEAESVRSFW